MIKSAASAASTRGGCASSRLDHGWKFYVIWGGCASSWLITTCLANGLTYRKGPQSEFSNLLQIFCPLARPKMRFQGLGRTFCGDVFMEKLNFQAVIKSAARASSLTA